MRATDWITILISVVGLVLIPILLLIIKTVNKSAGNEQKLEDLIESKDETHRMLLDMIKQLDKRVRWIEEQRFGRQR